MKSIAALLILAASVVVRAEEAPELPPMTEVIVISEEVVSVDPANEPEQFVVVANHTWSMEALADMPAN
jgi:hypothetical protein